MRKTLTLLILLSTLSFYAHSETFYVDGLKYETDTENLTASLTGYEGDKPTDELIIPSSITVGDVEYTVTSVGAYAFFNCSSLTSIVLPESLTEIGNYAFRFCSQLTDIKANWETPLTVTSSYVFSTYSTATLSVPVGTLEAYQADSFWGQFANIVEDSTLAVEGNLVVD
ncbi:MAG: leucine-rich repeat domain-containing protein, partial [Bacteroidales bacterium]